MREPDPVSPRPRPAAGVARWGPGLALFAFWAAHAVPVLISGKNWGIWDWDFHFAYYEVERQAIAEHGVAPLWNPFTAGGMILLQHPISSSLWPDFAAVLALGVPVGIKLLLGLRFALGLAGAYCLARALDLGRTAAVLAAMVANGAGAYAAHVAFGHFEWTVFAYAPWALLGLLRFCEGGSRAWAAGAAACTAALYLAGGVYLTVGFALLVGLFFACEALRLRDARVLARALAVLLLAGGLAAAKLLPAAAYFAENPRTTHQANRLLQGEEPRGWLELPRALGFVLLRRGFDYPLAFASRPSHVGRTGAPEETRTRFRLFQDINYSGYVGVPVALFAVLGLAARRPRRWSLAVAAGGLLLLVLSDAFARAWGIDPWAALKRVPPLGSLGVAGRLLAAALLPVALLAGAGMDALLGWGRRRRPAVATGLAALAVIAVGADLAHRNAVLLARSFPHPARDPQVRPFASRAAPLGGFDFASVRARIGSVQGYSNLGLGRWRAAIPVDSPDYRGEAFLADGRGSARLLEIRPNEARVAVEAPDGGLLVVNQMYVRGWRRLDRDAPALPRDGRLATPVAPGDSEVRLGFRPPLFRLGCGVSLATVAGLVLAVARERRAGDHST